MTDLRTARHLMAPILVLLLAGCGGEPHGGLAVTSEADATGADHQEISWFEGGVDAAFAVARDEGKPLFLYWGAEWCPPCHYLKSKLFKRPEFVARSREFICVYLDGDTERAQILGEKLDVQGYPTVIVFSSEGEELMRMPSDVPVERYAEILDAAMTMDRPVEQVLEEVLAGGPARAAESDLELLAFYSWGQDSRVELPEEDRLSTFETLWRETPEEMAATRSRFLTLYLDAAIDRGGEEDDAAAAPVLTSEETASLRSALFELLADPALRNANLSFIFFSAGDVVDLLAPESSPERTELIARWQAAATAIEADETLSTDDRLTALLPRLRLARLQAAPAAEGEEPELPPDLLDHLVERVDWAGETVTDDGELQAVMSTMAYLLDQAGLAGQAESLLIDRLDDTRAPYYFMSIVAGIKEDAGRPQEAIEWYRRAYDSARGRYTRFRWGSIYLRHLMDLAPDDIDTIEADSLEILQELLTFDDAFAGGNYSRLGQLESALEEWNEEGERQPTVEVIREFVHQACGRYPGDGEDSQRQRCALFLTGTDDAAEPA